MVTAIIVERSVKIFIKVLKDNKDLSEVLDDDLKAFI